VNVDTYTESQVQQLLAEDERVAEQGIRVMRLEDGGLALCGEVESPQRKALIEKVVHEKFPDLNLHCDIGVTRVHEPDEVEEL
jgi:osmotically-inducible protein OsmY